MGRGPLVGEEERAVTPVLTYCIHSYHRERGASITMSSGRILFSSLKEIPPIGSGIGSFP